MCLLAELLLLQYISFQGCVTACILQVSIPAFTIFFAQALNQARTDHMQMLAQAKYNKLLHEMQHTRVQVGSQSCNMDDHCISTPLLVCCYFVHRISKHVNVACTLCTYHTVPLWFPLVSVLAGSGVYSWSVALSWGVLLGSTN